MDYAEKKVSGIDILGWIVIISGILTIWFQFFFPVVKHTKVTLMLDNLLAGFAVFPRGLPWVLGRTALIVIPIWLGIIIVCGIGILFLKNIARIIFLVFCAMETVILILFGLKFYAGKFSLGPVILIGYIIYLTRPKVKGRFK